MACCGRSSRRIVRDVRRGLPLTFERSKPILSGRPALVGGKVKARPAFAVLDFYDPEIGVETNLALKPSLDVAWLRPFLRVSSPPQAFHAAFGQFALWRRPEERCASIKAIELDEYRARLSGAATS